LRERRRSAPPLFFLLLLFVLLGIAIVKERLEEIPRIPYELAEYAEVGVSDLGTSSLFADTILLKVSLIARRPGRVRFILAGDGGVDEDPAKRALARRMRQLCRDRGCDFVVFTGDNFYSNGIDTFAAFADSLEGSDPEFSLQGDFLAEAEPPARQRLAARVREAAGRVAGACAKAGTPRRASTARITAAARSTDSAAGVLPNPGADVLTDSAAHAAYELHFHPKFEQTFRWLDEERIPAFVAIGNHDTRSPFGTECEIGYSLSRTAWRFPYYYYQIQVDEPRSGEPLATLFILYSTAEHGSQAGENLVRIGPRQGRWLRTALRALPPVQAETPWLLFATHHPIWSAGTHTLGEYRSLHVDLLEALRQTGTYPDLLLGGHNHWLESVSVAVQGRPALQVVSGSLSKVALGQMLTRGYPLFNTIGLDPAWRARMANDLKTDPSAFLANDRSVLARGFALIDLDGGKATVRFFGVNGELYREEFRRPG
jgi:3',5'-cyclic AMP phosphodiesterase CpdA